jgi:hypothetical protein
MNEPPVKDQFPARSQPIRELEGLKHIPKQFLRKGKWYFLQNLQAPHVINEMEEEWRRIEWNANQQFYNHPIPFAQRNPDDDTQFDYVGQIVKFVKEANNNATKYNNVNSMDDATHILFQFTWSRVDLGFWTDNNMDLTVYVPIAELDIDENAVNDEHESYKFFAFPEKVLEAMRKNAWKRRGPLVMARATRRAEIKKAQIQSAVGEKRKTPNKNNNNTNNENNNNKTIPVNKYKTPNAKRTRKGGRRTRRVRKV